MRSNIKNKVQLNILVPPETKNQLTEISESLELKPHAVVEMAMARLHAELKLSPGRSESVLQILLRVESKLDRIHDGS